MSTDLGNGGSALRVSAPELDAVLGKKLPVLDDGFVRVVDYLGSDQAVVQAARVSYGVGTRTVHEDRGLIRYLMRHRHTTPFEMCEIKFHVRVPMHIWRQWIRHRTANVNEYSTRYSVAIDSMQKTSTDKWRRQKQTNKQGSEGFLNNAVGSELTVGEAELQRLARADYQRRLAKGVAREQARKDLPLSTYTEAFLKIDLWNLFHFLELRMDTSAQDEIREYAIRIGTDIVSRWVPLSWEAFVDYHLNAIILTPVEAQIIGCLLNGQAQGARDLMTANNWFDWDENKEKLRPNRERDEFLAKLSKQLGFELPFTANQGTEPK